MFGYLSIKGGGPLHFEWLIGTQKVFYALVAEELSFIRAHSTPGDECVILSRRQGLYYAESGTGSPIPGPGYAEIFLQRDMDAFLANLFMKRYTCLFLGVGNASALYLGVHPMTIVGGYDVIARNQSGSLFYLRPSKQN